MAEEVKEEIKEEEVAEEKGALGKLKDAIIDDIKEAAIESVMGGMGGAAGLGGSLPTGTPDLAPPADQAVAPVPGGGFGVPNF